MPSGLTSNDTEQMQRVRVVRVGRQDTPVTSLGLGQPACLVVLETNR
jgi:hypothetical protein